MKKAWGPRRDKAKSAGKNKAETDFYEYVISSRSEAIYRHGWPDFILEEPDGYIFAVEVKTGRDPLRDSQKVMFDLLDRLGLAIFVSNRDLTGMLIPWRKYDERLKIQEPLGMTLKGNAAPSRRLRTVPISKQTNLAKDRTEQEARRRALKQERRNRARELQQAREAAIGKPKIRKFSSKRAKRFMPRT